MKTTKFLFILFALAIFTVVIGCMSNSAPIPDDITAQELTLLAQAALDGGNSGLAQFYYESIIDRFSDNLPTVIASKYEIAHLLLKSDKKDAAKVLLEEILSYYTESTFNELPAEYKKLAQLELDRINR